MLSRPVPRELVQAIARRHAQIVEVSRHVHILELAPRPAEQVGGQTIRTSGSEDLLRVAIGECPDHASQCIVSRDRCPVFHASRGYGTAASPTISIPSGKKSDR